MMILIIIIINIRVKKKLMAGTRIFIGKERGI